jgi:hypothetical protein
MKYDPNKTMTAVLDRREGRLATIVFSDKQELTLPVHLLPTNAREGDVIHLKFMTDKQATADRAELARNLLEEILNGK